MILHRSEINRDETRYSFKKNDKNFDLLIFTQRWPITDCMTWMHHGENHTCALPSQKDTWIIHGIWPTKLGKMGPFDCNASAPFDINSLEPLMDQLKLYWTNIEKGNFLMHRKYIYVYVHQTKINWESLQLK